MPIPSIAKVPSPMEHVPYSRLLRCDSVKSFCIFPIALATLIHNPSIPFQHDIDIVYMTLVVVKHCSCVKALFMGPNENSFSSSALRCMVTGSTGRPSGTGGRDIRTAALVLSPGVLGYIGMASAAGAEAEQPPNAKKGKAEHPPSTQQQSRNEGKWKAVVKSTAKIHEDDAWKRSKWKGKIQ